MLGLSLAPAEPAVLRTGAGGGAAPAVAGTAATGFAQAPSVHLHPHSQAEVTARDAGGRVTGCPDLRGLAAASQGIAGRGPKAMVDALGRGFWRFEGSDYLDLASTLVADVRGCAVFLVGRQHRPQPACSLFSLGNAAAGTAVETIAALARTVSLSGAPPYLAGGSVSGTNDAANAGNVIVGSQLQVIGVTSRTTANGGQRLLVNGAVATVGQQSASATGVTGAEIGRYAFAPGAAGSWAQFDLYEIAVFAGTLTNAQADAAAAALMANWAVAPITHQLVVEGDSITQGVVAVTPGVSLGMAMSDPGGPTAMPEGWRVVNLGVSGNTVANLVARRDVANTMFGRTLPGRNVVICQAGRNNVSGGNAADIYAQIVALLHAGTTGYLERGWEVRQAINIATAAGQQPVIEGLRALLRAPAFLSDCAAGAGQAHEGRLARIDLPAWTVAGSGTIFDSAADAVDLIWYQGDQTHPTVAATAEMAKAYRAGL